MTNDQTMREISAIGQMLRMGIDELREERDQLCTLAGLIVRDLTPDGDADMIAPAALDLARVLHRMTEDARNLRAIGRCLDDLAKRCGPELRAVN
jgi:hypothetical protein